MAAPEGSLTPVQYEIMDVVWKADPAGATVTEIWEAIRLRRDVTRTTILNLVDRLEKRRWLKRRKEAGGFRYVATLDRETTARRAAEDFVQDFFGGSASDLVTSLLGSKKLRREDVKELRRLLDNASNKNSEEE